jgi:hypothetical protein
MPARDSAEVQPPSASVARDAVPEPDPSDWSTEQFGEPRGLVSAHPHLDALEGLAEQTPESASPDEPLVAPPEPAHMPDDAEAATQVIGKPAGEIESPDASEPPSASAAPEATALSDAPVAPAVTSPERQPSETATPPVPPAPPAAPRGTPTSATSAAPASGERSAHPQPRSPRQPESARDTGSTAAPHRGVSGKGASGKGGGKSSRGSSGETRSGGHKGASHRPKKS